MMEESSNLNDVGIITLINNCQTTVSSLATASNYSRPISVNLFKKLLEDVSKFMTTLKSQSCSPTSQNHSDIVLLCLSQIYKCLPLLLKVVENTSEDGLTQESRRYVVERIRWCFSDVLAEIQHHASVNNECGSKFVHTMDLVLERVIKFVNLPDKVDLLDAIEKLKPTIEELLCHAMTIAQISESSDYQGITFSSQKVLRALDQLTKECVSTEENQSMWHLFADSLADSLESLEQRVNTSVLRLVLQVFCEPYAPLKSLVQYCVSSKPTTERKGCDLDEMVVELDLRMDRIMQIGLFAMACTGDAKRILSIRCCLASLESLEPELVPTLTAFYLEPTSASHRSHLKLLTEHWQAEIAELHRLLDAIVDPAAFCQVSTEEVKSFSLSMKASIETDNATAVEENAHRVVQRTKKLVRHLQSTLGELGTASQMEKLPGIVQELSKACHECEVCVHHVFTGKDKNDKNQWKRVLKRCQLIVSTMKKLQPMLVLLLNVSQTEAKQDVGNISVKKCLETDVDDVQQFENVDVCLLPYLDAGKVLRQERSIMYTTPKRQVKMSVIGNKLPATTPRSLGPLFLHHNPLSNGGNTSQLVKTNDNLTLGLEVTAILDKLTLLCDTLSSTLDSPNKPQDSSLKCQDDGNKSKHKDLPSASMLNESSSSWVSSVMHLGDPPNTDILSESSSWMSSIMCSSEWLGHEHCDDPHLKKDDDHTECSVSSSTAKCHQESSQPSVSLFAESSSCRVGTLERLNDLCKLEEKLDRLQEQFHLC